MVTEAAEVRRLIGLTGQYAALDEYLTGRANLIMIGQLSRLTANAARRRADEMLERFSLTEAASRAVKTYSGGMRRRLDLAASLIGYPSVLFLDEPTTGLDPSARAMTWEIVRELADSGATLLLTTQYLDEADQLARRVAVIDGGTVIAEGSLDQLKSSVSGEHLEIALAAGADVAAAIIAVRPFAKGRIHPDQDGRRLSVPVAAGQGADQAQHRPDQAGARDARRRHLHAGHLHLPAADVRVQRVRPDSGHAGLAAADRGVEPDVGAGCRLQAPVRQPEPSRRRAGLADAASRAGRGLLVRGDAAGLRAAGGPPVPAQGARLTGGPGRAAVAWAIDRIHDGTIT